MATVQVISAFSLVSFLQLQVPFHRYANVLLVLLLLFSIPHMVVLIINIINHCIAVLFCHCLVVLLVIIWCYYLPVYDSVIIW